MIFVGKTVDTVVLFDIQELDWVRLVLDDSTFLQCDENADLGSDDSHVIECVDYDEL